MEVFLAAALGLLIGIAMGALGGGGSVLAVPLFVYVLAEPVHDATTASLLVVAAAGVTGALGQSKAGLVCWRCVGLLAVAAGLGSVVGTVLNALADGTTILLAFAPVLAMAGVAIWRSGWTERDDALGCPHIEPLRGIASGFLVGGLIGFFGVGGGFLIVPLLVMALGFPLTRAVATSIAVVGIVSLASFGGHLVAGGSFDLRLTTAMALGAAGGAAVGAKVGPAMPRHRLAQAFALLVFAVATWLLVSVAFLGGPPSA